MIEIRYEEMETTEASRRAYEAIYGGEGIQHRDSFYLWLIDLLRPDAGKLLLDISCGQGRLVSLAQRAGIIAAGTDFSLAALQRGAQDTPAAGWAVGDGEALPLEARSVDYVTHIGSLEHYQDPGRGAGEIFRVLKPGGTACILLPNAFGLLGNVRHVLRTGEVFDDGLQPIQRYASRGTWAGILESAGLRILKVVGYGEIERPRTTADARWIVRHPAKVIKLALTSIIPVNLKNHLVFICTAG